MRHSIILSSWVLALMVGCERPDSIELGAECKGSAACKDPADTCLTIGDKSRCTMACDENNRCPKGYACPVTDPKQRDRGMCLPQENLRRNVVTVY